MGKWGGGGADRNVLGYHIVWFYKSGFYQW